ncbi:hypothetical protein Tco_0157222 [Tanacetum coccineum]
MRTRSSSNLVGNSSSNPTTSNPKRHNCRRSKQPFNLEEPLEESPIVTMADQRTMAELLRAPTEGYAEAIVVPPILAEHFELKHSLINMMTSDQFFGLEKDNPHDHIRWFNKITSTIKYKDVPNSAIKLMLFPFSLAGAARRWLEKEPPRSILTWEDLFLEAWGSVTMDSFVLSTPPPASVKAVEEICVTCGGAYPYYQCLAADGNTLWKIEDNIQGYVAAAVGNYNQAPIQQNQSVPLSELEKFKKINEANMKAMQTQINNVKNKLRSEMQNSIQTSMSNQTNELKNMMASFFQMNIASTLGMGSLPSNIVANPKGELKAITTRSGLVLDGPTVPMPPPFINPEEDERVEETLTDPEHGEYTIKVPPPLVQKAKRSSQRNYVVTKGFLVNLISQIEVVFHSSPLPPFHNSLSGSTTSSSPSLPISETSDYSLEGVRRKLAIITFPPGNDDLPFDAESDLREIYTYSLKDEKRSQTRQNQARNGKSVKKTKSKSTKVKVKVKPEKSKTEPKPKKKLMGQPVPIEWAGTANYGYGRYENGISRRVPIPVIAPESGPSTALKMTVPSTAEEKICKMNDVKARTLHDDDLRRNGSKWNMGLLSREGKRKFYQWTGREDHHGWKLLNQGGSSRQLRIEDASDKAIVCIDWCWIDWSDMAKEEIQANQALIGFSDSEGLEEFKQPEGTDSKTSSLKVDKDWKEKFFCPANQVREEVPKKARENNDAPI